MLWTFILKPTIFSEGLIIQVGKLVESHHLSLLACRNSPMKLRMVISATPGEGSRQEKFRFWSSMWGAAKVSQGLPTPVLAPCPLPHWDLPPAKPSLVKIYTYISVAITNFNCLSKYFSLLCKYSEKVKSFGRFEGSWKNILIKKWPIWKIVCQFLKKLNRNSKIYCMIK